MLKNTHVVTTVPCKDLQRARNFYEQTLGLEPSMALGESESEGVMYECGGDTKFMLYETQFSGGEATRLTFATEEFDTEVTTLRQKGVALENYDLPGIKTENGIAAEPGGEKTCWFKDPDGNVLNLTEVSAHVKSAAA